MNITKAWIILVILLVGPAIALEVVIMDYSDVYNKKRNGEVISYEYEDECCPCYYEY